jgi:hypothetical protein
MNMAHQSRFNDDVLTVQDSIGLAFRRASQLLLHQSAPNEKLNERMDDLSSALESACVSARTVLERYRQHAPARESGKKPFDMRDIAGNITVTPEGWVHITLNALLPHCRYRTPQYLRDTLTRLMDECPDELPQFSHAFLAIIEKCDYETRNVYDPDNHGWKVIPNVMKGVLFADDDQFHLSIGLFAEMSANVGCDIYVTPLTDAGRFMSDMPFVIENNFFD